MINTTIKTDEKLDHEIRLVLLLLANIAEMLQAIEKKTVSE